MPALKCPNPSCPYLFDPSRVPPGAVLACPQCGLQFTLGPTPPAAPGHPPAAYPGYPPAPPPADPLAQAAADEDDAPPTVGRRAGPPPRKSAGGGGLGVLLPLGGLMLAVGVGLTVLFVAVRSKQGLVTGGGGGGDELVLTDFNCAVRKPPEPWAKDAEAQALLGVNAVAYHRPDPETWVALGVSDFDKRNPRPSDLQRRMTDQLFRAFDNLPESLDPQPAEWGGHPALRVTFRGTYRPTGETCVGVAYLLAYKGVGYWFYGWTAERTADTGGAEIDAVRAGFRTLDLRSRWAEEVAAARTFRSDAGTYRLTDHERLWDKPKRKDPKEEDPKGDLVLQAVWKGNDKTDFPPTADVVVLVLGEAAGDAAGAARAYVEERYKQIPGTTVEEWTVEPVGDAVPGPATPPTPVTRLRVQRGGADALRTADKLVVFAAATAGDKTIVAEGSCPWKERIVWERRLIQLVGSLTVSGK